MTELLPGHARSAEGGHKGFDCDQHISRAQAHSFLARGYRFCLRYVGRMEMAQRDLTREEAEGLLEMGLSLMPVQHVERPGWIPNEPKGHQYGANAARFAQAIGIPPSVNVWL